VSYSNSILTRFAFIIFFSLGRAIDAWKANCRPIISQNLLNLFSFLMEIIALELYAGFTDLSDLRME